MPTLTIAVMTLNEAAQIEACLSSARFADQLLVLDSGSTDNTRELARKMDAEVHTSADWQGFAEQRNRMLALSRGDWVLFLDADEVIPPELAQDIQAAVARDDTCVYALKWLQIAFGQPLTRMRAGRGQPRLFPRRELLRYDGVVHEGPVLHHPDTPWREEAVYTTDKVGVPYLVAAAEALDDAVVYPKEQRLIDIAKEEKLEIMTMLAGMGPDAAKAVPAGDMVIRDKLSRQDIAKMIGASRAYEANVQAINATRAMWNKALEIGR